MKYCLDGHGDLYIKKQWEEGIECLDDDYKEARFIPKIKNPDLPEYIRDSFGDAPEWLRLLHILSGSESE